jgi:hypothetical protein
MGMYQLSQLMVDGAPLEKIGVQPVIIRRNALAPHLLFKHSQRTILTLHLLGVSCQLAYPLCVCDT